MRPSPRIVCLLLSFAFFSTPIWAQLTCSPCTHHFHQVPVGSSSQYSITLTNAGTKAVRILSFSTAGSEFSVNSFTVPRRLLPGASILMPVTFAPTALGHVTGDVVLTSNATDPSLTIGLGGTGVSASSPKLSASPSSLSFGSVVVGANSSLAVTLTASNAPVTISSARVNSSEFAVQGLSLPLTLPVGKSVAATIVFTPNASGVASGNAGFFSDDPNSPLVENLTGTGVPPASHTVALTWDASTSPVVGYNVYRGANNGGSYSQINGSLDPGTNYTDSSVTSGSTYYYVVTAVDSSGVESAYSNVTEAVIPSP